MPKLSFAPPVVISPISSVIFAARCRNPSANSCSGISCARAPEYRARALGGLSECLVCWITPNLRRVEVRKERLAAVADHDQAQRSTELELSGGCPTTDPTA